MISKRALVLSSLLVLAVFAWLSIMFRYDFQVVANHDGYAVAYRLDRWSGHLWLIEDDQWYPVVEGNPDDLNQSSATPNSSSY
jgi:hypothetical protein